MLRPRPERRPLRLIGWIVLVVALTWLIAPPITRWVEEVGESYCGGGGGESGGPFCLIE